MIFETRMSLPIALSATKGRYAVQAPRPLPLPATLPAAAQAPGSSSVASFQSLTNTQVRHHKDGHPLPGAADSAAATPSRA